VRTLPDILYEDEHLIVLNKPAGLLSIPDRFQPNRPHLRGLLKMTYEDIYVVHRLDLHTSGVILFAKTTNAHQSLSQQLENRKCKKEYWAITYKPQLESDTINAPITESLRRKGFYKVHNRGKEAITSYHTIQSWQRYALLSLELITGRTHQIRVHLKFIGASLITDDKYSTNSEFFLSQIKKIKMNREQKERPLLSRSALHARQFTFTHPFTNEVITVTAPLYKDMKAVINQLVKRYGGSVEY